MFIRTKGPLAVSDGTVRRGCVTIEAGRYEMEEIPDPRGFSTPWWVIAGTKHGLTEGSWRSLAALSEMDPLHVFIEE